MTTETIEDVETWYREQLKQREDSKVWYQEQLKQSKHHPKTRSSRKGRKYSELMDRSLEQLRKDLKTQ